MTIIPNPGARLPLLHSWTTQGILLCTVIATSLPRLRTHSAKYGNCVGPGRFLRARSQASSNNLSASMLDSYLMLPSMTGGNARTHTQAPKKTYHSHVEPFCHSVAAMETHLSPVSITFPACTSARCSSNFPAMSPQMNQSPWILLLQMNRDEPID